MYIMHICSAYEYVSADCGDYDATIEGDFFKVILFCAIKCGSYELLVWFFKSCFAKVKDLLA